MISHIYLKGDPFHRFKHSKSHPGFPFDSVSHVCMPWTKPAKLWIKVLNLPMINVLTREDKMWIPRSPCFKTGQSARADDGVMWFCYQRAIPVLIGHKSDVLKFPKPMKTCLSKQIKKVLIFFFSFLQQNLSERSWEIQLWEILHRWL